MIGLFKATNYYNRIEALKLFRVVAAVAERLGIVVDRTPESYGWRRMDKATARLQTMIAERKRTDAATRNHAAALLRRVRAQRDAERKWREAWKAGSDLLSMERAQLRKQLAAKETKLELTALALETTKQMYEAARAELAQADAARVVALQVAEAAQKRAEAAQSQADELRNELREVYEIFDNALRYAPTPAYHMTLYSVWHAKARRLLAAHKATERA